MVEKFEVCVEELKKFYSIYKALCRETVHEVEQCLACSCSPISQLSF